MVRPWRAKELRPFMPSTRPWRDAVTLCTEGSQLSFRLREWTDKLPFLASGWQCPKLWMPFGRQKGSCWCTVALGVMKSRSSGRWGPAYWTPPSPLWGPWCSMCSHPPERSSDDELEILSAWSPQQNGWDLPSWPYPSVYHREHWQTDWDIPLRCCLQELTALSWNLIPRRTKFSICRGRCFKGLLLMCRQLMPA